MDYDRIRYILTPEELMDKIVVVVGLGSGGAPVVQHLAMNGIRNWALFDPDVLDETNLVKHPGMRSDIGQYKVHIAADWIRDRNPDSEIRDYPEDILDSKDFEKEVQDADIVISATDSLPIRQYINRISVHHQTPCVTASVFRTGIGGEVYVSVPGETGCFQCMNLVSTKLGWGQIENQIEMTDEERTRIYGLGEEEYRASGLSMDISQICAIMAKKALRVLLKNPNPKFFPEEKSNYIIFYMRKIQQYPSLSSLKYFIPPQQDCYCTSNNTEIIESRQDMALDFDGVEEFL
ncbi:MAG: HesA/MoeB/ThiF family protein [Candidatus Thorarchaeota archaeon]